MKRFGKCCCEGSGSRTGDAPVARASQCGSQDGMVPAGFKQALLETNALAHVLPRPWSAAGERLVGAPSTQTDWMLNLDGVGHTTARLRELATWPLTGLVANGCPALFQDEDDTEEPEGPEEPVPAPGEGVVRPRPCPVCRLVIVIGAREDPSLRGAKQWAAARARALGGCFYLWDIRSLSATGRHPFVIIRVQDISGGDLAGARVRDYQVSGTRRFDKMHPDLKDIQGRFDEVIVFHHGHEIDEDRAVEGLWRVLVQTLRIPVCRLVYWSCNAAAQLNVAEGGWVDALMRDFGGLAQYERCPCPGPVELVYPTAGKCAINDPSQPVSILTGDGRVNRIRWGYTHADGALHRDPDPRETQPTRNPPDRAADTPAGESVMGVPVAADPSLR